MSLSVKIFNLNIAISYHGNAMNIKLIGNRIRQARERLGFSQEDLALKIGKSQNAISAYENGDRGIHISELPELANALEVPIGYLFGDEYDADEALALYARLDDDERKEIIGFMRLKLDLRREARKGA